MQKPLNPTGLEVTVTDKQIEKFWSKIVIGRPNECWEWQHALSGKGYGNLTLNKVNIYAHRLSYMLENGDIPADKVVMHTCDNMKCCNPAHLRLGSQTDNLRDMYGKGRGRHHGGFKGVEHPAALLNEKQVREIRASNELRRILASRYGVAPSTIKAIRMRRSWKHIK